MEELEYNSPVIPGISTTITPAANWNQQQDKVWSCAEPEMMIGHPTFSDH